MEFQESLNKKPMTKEEKQKLRAKIKAEKKKLRDKIKQRKMKEAKRRLKLKAAGIIDVGFILSDSKPIGIPNRIIYIYFLIHDDAWNREYDILWFFLEWNAH